MLLPFRKTFSGLEILLWIKRQHYIWIRRWLGVLSLRWFVSWRKCESHQGTSSHSESSLAVQLAWRQCWCFQPASEVNQHNHFAFRMGEDPLFVKLLWKRASFNALLNKAYSDAFQVHGFICKENYFFSQLRGSNKHSSQLEV